MRRLRRILVCAPLAAGSACLAKDTITQPFLGVTLYEITQTTPRPNNIRIVVIDLTNTSLGFQISPRDPGLPNGDETITQTTRDYVNEVSAQVGINTSFFRLENGLQALPTNNQGISVSNGDKYSPWDATNQVGLNIAANRTATIITAPSSRPTGYETSPTVSLWNATRGSDRLLNNGTNVAPADSTVSGAFLNLNPRTAAGVGTNKLILATIDGRQTGFSEGMYLREVADLMKLYGATNAINLDGGGSTSLAMDYYDDGGQRAQLINHTPNLAERFVGQSLAIFAAKNPNYLPPGAVALTGRTDVTVIDSFEDGNGHFAADPAQDDIRRDANEFADGYASQRVEFHATPTEEFEHLSADGDPTRNQQISSTGYVGFLLKTTAENLTTSLSLDADNDSAESIAQSVIADGQWHVYQWNLADAAQWNGSLDGMLTIDSIDFASSLDQDAKVWLDAVSYNADGNLNALVPEPIQFSSLLLCGTIGLARRRSRK